ncbi:uncharacterized protein LOC128558308 [Mercenaria mercenaria]|uniref:uncharacterized protein LOC128558308 n=1 Tax=Mercenaria mercenaria TaxID=6596 RepID=UPI00234F9839|nr:uncharacterized protein LOC128558308 [Mercenaria mercenaria]
MSTEEFLLALRRFIAQRGSPMEINSDNAKQFKLASDTIHLIWQNTIKSDDVQTYVSNHGIKWNFIVERAPWYGGYWERLVGLVKRSLRKSLGRRSLTDIQLQTVIKEIESVINSRPLLYVDDDINSNITLTPGHFLTLNPRTGIPEADYDDNDPDYEPYESSTKKLLKLWNKGQKLLNNFWEIWKKEYLISLRERTQSELKSHRVQSSFKPSVGDVVLIKDDLPRGLWKMGKVIKLIMSNDGQYRSAKVNLSNGRTIGRTLNHLYPVEVSDDHNSVEQTKLSKPVLKTPKQTEQTRPKRKTAIMSRKRIQELIANKLIS